MLEESPKIDQAHPSTPVQNHAIIASRELDSPIDLEAAALELWAERKMILRGGIGALIAATIIAFLLPVSYTAIASLLPPESSTSASSSLLGSLGALSGASSLLGTMKSSGALYIGTLKSQSIADQMIDDFHLMSVYHKKKRSLTRKTLEKKSTFETDTKSSIITISVTDRSAERARDMANGYMDALRSVSGRVALTESSQKRLFFEQQLEREKDKLADAEVALKKSEEATGLIAPAGQTSSSIRAIADVRAQISARELELASFRQAATDQNPDIIRIRGEISNLQSQLVQMENGNEKKQLSGVSTAQLPALQLEYIRKEREVKYHQTLFEIIAKQYEAARLDEAHNPPVLQILDRATVPDTRSGPPRIAIIVGGAFVGFLFTSIWVLFRAAQRRMYHA